MIAQPPIRAVFLAIAILFSIVFAVAPARAEDPRFPWSSNHHPSDVARSHVENITTGEHKYIVTRAARWTAQTAGRRWAAG